MTTTSGTVPVFFRMTNTGGDLALPYDEVLAGLKHLRLLLHDEIGPMPHDAARQAEWKSMWDTVNHLLDPDYDDGWRVEE